MGRGLRLSAALLTLAFGGLVAAASEAPTPAGFNAGQAIAGKAIYDESCAACHGAGLEGAGPAVALRGPAFVDKWGGKPADQLFAAIRRMPPGEPDKLDPGAPAAVMAYLLQQNGTASTDRFVPSAPEALAALVVPRGGEAGGPARPSPLVVVKPTGRPSALDRLTPVTAADLSSPPAGDWLHWRRTDDASGFSPLKQIDRKTVGGLQLAWSWALPRGDTMMTPIVRDGVMFAYSHGDVVEALDAATGDLLWRYERRLEGGASFNGKKGVALSGDLILMPTSDMHVLALRARTGAVVWDHAIDTGGQSDFQIKTSPMVAGGKVIIGVNGFTTRGGNVIVGLDLKTGEEAWRFHTVARPGEPGGESWNGQPVEARTGGSVWVAGSYDPRLNLVYFGSGATYNTKPLRVRSTKPGVTNDALYTNATVALNPETGKLVWFYQHQANDQLDHDWAFERQLLDLTIDGRRRRVLITGGKAAVFDALDAATGQYLFSTDFDMQNVIVGIDPKTGRKTINPAAIPTLRQNLVRGGFPGICPDLLGARNLMSAALDPGTKRLYLPLTDTCLQPYPNGPRWEKHAETPTPPGFGVLAAYDLATRHRLWTARDPAPPVSGALATAGGLVFVGDVDRSFKAYDAASGKVLWRAGLDNAPASYPVTYTAGDRQFVVVATNEGFVHVQAMQAAAKAIPPPSRGATLFVFALPPGAVGADAPTR